MFHEKPGWFIRDPYNEPFVIIPLKNLDSIISYEFQNNRSFFFDICASLRIMGSQNWCFGDSRTPLWEGPMILKAGVVFFIFFLLVLHELRKEPLLLSMKSWLFHDGIPIIGR